MKRQIRANGAVIDAQKSSYKYIYQLERLIQLESSGHFGSGH